ncbi:cytochrome P450 [Kitasatospora sp. LaBMicrA B282]|uniref:cytochrome P450 n=1 Tax=Kitasatospora sp. LaBMicrA B282 TaxID=3420949 RepID=UPI003D0D772A
MSATPAQHTGHISPCPHDPTPADGPRLAGDGPRLLTDPLGFVASVPSTEEIVAVRLGAREVHLVLSSDLVEQVLVDDASMFEAGWVGQGPGPASGHGLSACPGPVRAARRRVIEPAFHWSRLADHARIAAETAAEVAGCWSGGAELDVPRETTRLALAAITRSLVAGPAGDELTEAITEALTDALTEAHDGALPALPDAVRAAVADTLDRRRGSAEEHTDALSLLLSAQDQDGDGDAGLTDDQVGEELIALILAGTEAPAALLAWTLHEVSRRPDIEDRILAEITTLLGDRPPTAADFTSLGYTRQVVGEALRSYPQPFLLRRASRPVLVGGRRLVPGDEVLISPYALHHDPDLFPAPDRFDPDRYDRPAARRALIPFGSDDRGCVGAGSAWQGMTIALVVLLSRWRFRPVSDQPVRPLVGRTVRPDRLVLAVNPR